MVLAAHGFRHEAGGAQLDLPDFLEDFARDHIANFAACPPLKGEYFCSKSATEILEEIRRLPEKERRAVADRILEEFGDMDDGLSPEQLEEAERRGERLSEHPENGIPWEQVKAELNNRFGSK
jgi:hypothetical protein